MTTPPTDRPIPGRPRRIAVTTASDVDGCETLLALPEAVDVQDWQVVAVRRDGSRVPLGPGGQPATWYPRFGSGRPAFLHAWICDDLAFCHVEIRVEDTGEVERVLLLRSPDSRCRICRSG